MANIQNIAGGFYRGTIGTIEAIFNQSNYVNISRLYKQDGKKLTLWKNR